MLFYQFLVLNQYLLLECKCNDFFSIGMELLINVVLFIPANIFNLATKYLSSRTGLTSKFTFQSFLITSHIVLCFS